MDNLLQIGLPQMGPYGRIIARTFNDALLQYGVRVVLAPATTKKTINMGAEHMDENFCLPGKIILGNMLELASQGISFVFEWDNCGTCRQKAYGLTHQSILRQLGIDMSVIPLRPRKLIQGLMSAAPRVPVSKWKETMRHTLRAVWAYDYAIMLKQARLSLDKPNIGICGEIYTILEPAANADQIKQLEGHGAKVHNGLLLGQFLHFPLERKLDLKRFVWLLTLANLGMWSEIRAWLQGRLVRPDVDYEIFRKAEIEAEKYIPEHNIGGHGNDSVVWTIYYALAGFDGVLHDMPFPCMPEATVSRLIDEISQDYGISVNHLVFDQQFAEQNQITRSQATVNLLSFGKKGLAETLKIRRSGIWLGIDIGSTSCKAVLLDGETMQIVDSEYQFVHRDPINSIQAVLTALSARNPSIAVVGIGATGSGRRLAEVLLNVPLAVDEISCQTIGCMAINPGVRSVIEIGGQDSKVIILDQSGVPVWFNMNSICSAGTGAFLTSAAREFGVDINDLGGCARRADCSVTVTGRCGVFAEADIVSKQQAGYSKDGIIRGMCEALAKNFLSNVARSRCLSGPIMFTGGVALNVGVVDAFGDLLSGVVVHPQAKVSGALGAAILAMVRNAVGGLDLAGISKTEFGSSIFPCRDCANDCEISLITRNGEIVAALGSRCGKHETKIGEKQS